MTEHPVIEQLRSRVERERDRLTPTHEAEERWEALAVPGPDLLSVMSEWIAAQVSAFGRKGALVGVSGGVASALGAIAVQRAVGKNGLGLILPDSATDPREQEDAIKLCQLIGLPFQIVNLGGTVDRLLDGMAARRESTNATTMAARLRVAAKYFQACQRDYLVVGCGDFDEVYIGWSVRGLAADLHPLAGLHKDEVRALVLEALAPLDPEFARSLSQRPATSGGTVGGLAFATIGSAVEVMARHCTISGSIVFPQDIDPFLDALEASGVTVQEFLTVVDLFYQHQESTLNSPGLLRPMRLPPMAGPQTNVNKP